MQGRVFTSQLLLWPLVLALIAFTAVSSGISGGGGVPGGGVGSEPPRANSTGGGGYPTAGQRLPQPSAGFAMTVHHIPDLDQYLNAIDDIADTGASSLLIITPMFQERIDSTDIRYIWYRCPTDAQLVALLRRAKRRGLATALMPIVLLEEAGPKEWRGVIKPSDWHDWWRSYTAMMDRFTEVAVRAEVDLLFIGSELNSTEDQTQRWGSLLARIQSRYDGAVTYSANWDRYHKVTLWPMLDYVSVSAYFELENDEGDRESATWGQTALADAWRVQRDRLLRFAQQRERPLILSEVGYPSLPWAARHPWNYVADMDQRADHEAQARCWRAFFEAWLDNTGDHRSDADYFRGFFCYGWNPEKRGGPYDTGYGVAGKPALEVIRDAFTRINSPPRRFTAESIERVPR